jgi:outer membrane beta-barrel protein
VTEAMMKRIAPVLAVTALLAAPAARAERRNPLEGQPSIRHRLELRNLRLEATPFVGFTVLQDFNNTVMGGAKLEYHLTDWFSVGGLFGGGAALGTGLKTTILDTLDPNMELKGGPIRSQAEAAMNYIQWMAAVQGEFTPFGGKFSMFAKSFFNYDFYVDGGAGFLNMASDLSSKFPTLVPMDCSSKALNNQFGCNTGLKIGPTIAAGFHMFFNEFMALDVSYRAVIIKDNPAGRDTNGDKTVNDDDAGWAYKQFVMLGVSFYLPVKAEISR